MNHHKRHRINTEEYKRELRELFAQKEMLVKSLRALTAEHEELQKQLNSAKNMTKSNAGDSHEQPTNEPRRNEEVGFGPRPSNAAGGGSFNERVSAAQRPRPSEDVVDKNEALVRKTFKLLKAFQKNNTWYPENSDPDGLPHPSGDKTEKHTAINGKAVWKHNEEVRNKNDKSLNDAIQYGDFPASIQTPKGKQLFIQLAKIVAEDPDRHVIGSGTSINKPPTFKELRTRHLLGAIKNYSQYTATETSKGIEIVAPRHSKNTMSQATHTKWIFDGKELKSEDIMSKSIEGGVYGLKKSVTRGTGSVLPTGRSLRDGSERVAQSASLEKSASEIASSNRNKMGYSISNKTQEQLKKAEDEAGMTAYPLKDGYSVHHETSQNGYDIWSIGHNGQRAGSFMICTDDTRRGRPFVSWAGVDKPHRGKGIGTAVYKTLAVHYGGLDSDRNSTSVDAIKAWRRAGGRQIKVKTAFGDYRYTLDGDKKRPPIAWNEDLIKGFKSQWGGTLPDTDNSHVERNEWWHGTPSGVFPLNNIHVGSKKAAHEALTAKIGHPVEGEWDGTREYGKTLLAGKKTLEARGIPITGYSVNAPLEDHYPTGKATYSDGTQVSSSQKPNMLRFKIKGKMTSHPHTPRTDMAANAIMKRKGIKQGIYYVNEGEDPGSISAVVPSVEHLEQFIDKKKNEDLEKTRGTLTFPKVLPKDTRPEENVKQIPRDEKPHPMHGGLYEVKPAQEQFLHTAGKGVPEVYRLAAREQLKDAMKTGLGMYLPEEDKGFAFVPDYATKAHEAIHAMVAKAAKHFDVHPDEVYHRMNSLIHQDDVPVLKHMLKTFGYPERKHHEEMIPFIHSILHHHGVRNQYLESLKFYHNNVDEEKGRKAIQRLGRTWNAILQTGKRVSQLSDLPKEG